MFAPIKGGADSKGTPIKYRTFGSYICLKPLKAWRMAAGKSQKIG
jgi:hypothetical protein